MDGLANGEDQRKEAANAAPSAEGDYSALVSLKCPSIEACCTFLTNWLFLYTIVRYMGGASL